MWPLMWFNRSLAIINTTLQLLDILTFNPRNAQEFFILFSCYVLSLNEFLTKQLILHFQFFFFFWLLFIFKCFSKKITEKRE